MVERLLATAGHRLDHPDRLAARCGATGREPTQGVTGRALYVVKREPEMTGGSIASAEAQVGLDQTNPGAWGVSMTMTPKGRAEFARVTGNNVGRQLAIVLDGKVSSAPDDPRADPDRRRLDHRQLRRRDGEGPGDRAARRRAARPGADHRGALGRAVAGLGLDPRRA